MSDKTAIEWTDATWNPISGCTKVSPGCANCYIERTPAFRMAGRRFVKGEIPVLLHPERLEQPLRWRKPRRVFVCSLADLFHEDVPDWFIGKVLGTMQEASAHIFQVLTKRPQRMKAFFDTWEWLQSRTGDWPPSNVWCGVSVENQRFADERIPLLLETPAAVRFLSCEPLLGPLDLTPWLEARCDIHEGCRQHADIAGIDWVIVGGESGGPENRRLVELCYCQERRRPVRCGCGGQEWLPKFEALEWLRSIRDQCQAAGVPFFFKQWGGPRPTSGGRLLDGLEWNEMPERELAGALA